MAEPTEIDYAMLAAYLDGEGCIHVVKGKREVATYANRYQLKVEISNTEPALIEWLLDRFGGNAFLLPKYKGIHKQVFRWILTGKSSEKVLENCLRFSVIKKLQIRLAIEFCGLPLLHTLPKIERPSISVERERIMQELVRAKDVQSVPNMAKLRLIKRKKVA